MVVYREALVAQQTLSKPVRGWRHWPLETTFLGVGFVFGVLFLLITPPFQVADESRHFARAYAIAEDMLHRLGWIAPPEYLPEGVVRAIRQTEYLRFDPTSTTTAAHTLSLLAEPLRPEKRAVFPETAPYTFVSYLPQLVPIIGGRLLGINAVMTLYAARFCALLFWLGVTYLALKKLPVARHLLFFIALLPMTLFQAASLSADCTTLAISFLLVAYYLHVAYGVAPVGKRTMLLLSGLGAMLTAAKLVYMPLIGLHFLIRPSRFGSRQTYLMSFGLTVVACAGMLLLLYGRVLFPIFWGSEVALTTSPANAATPYPQLNFLLADPLNGLHMAIATTTRFGRAYLNGFVGEFGWRMAGLPSYLTVLTAILLLLTAFTTNSRWLIRRHHKSLLIGICVLITLIIYAAISTDVVSNPMASVYLAGVQGRYFTPFVLLIGLVAANRSWVAMRYRRYVHGAVLPFVLFLLLNAVYVLVEQYYGW
jgi:uncharacterized membrane protein